MCSLFLTGFKRPLQDSDLWSLEEKSLSCNIVPRLHGEWNKELRKSHGWVSRDRSVGLLLSPFSLIHFNLILLVKVLYIYMFQIQIFTFKYLWSYSLTCIIPKDLQCSWRILNKMIATISRARKKCRPVVQYKYMYCRLFCCANNSSFSLAQWPRAQANRLPT